MTRHRQINKPPPKTTRIWARDEEEAGMMVRPSDGVPELDGATYRQNVNGADVLPFITAARVVRCCNCQRTMYAKDYLNTDTHACIPTFDGPVSA
jgi:hypothetical protein